MNKYIKNTLYVLLPVSILIIVLIVGYYYLVILPWIEREKIDFQRELENNKILQEQAINEELLLKQDEEREEKKLQDKLLYERKLQDQEYKKIEEYKEQCKKWYKWVVEQYNNIISNYCWTYNNQVCIENLKKTDPDLYEWISPGDINLFISECVSRKKQGLSTFDDIM